MTEVDETLYDIVDVTTMPSTNVNLPMNVVQDILCNPALLKYKMVMGDVSFYVNHNVMGYPGYTVIMAVVDDGVISQMKVWVNDGIVRKEISSISPNLNDQIEQPMMSALEMAISANYMMINKPEIIACESSRSPMIKVAPALSYYQESPNAPRDTKVQRVIRFNNNHVPGNQGYVRTHNITCPCWGVMGHYRTYSNGKQVWIHPYLKGKFRDECPPMNTFQRKKYKF